MVKGLMSSFKRGDTIIEVTFAMTIFSMVTILSITMMNSGLASAQATMEISMTRSEIDSQAEAIRFIHDSYVAELSYDEKSRRFSEKLWDAVIKDALDDPTKLSSLQLSNCSSAYSKSGSAKDGPVYTNHAFVVNTRKITPSSLTMDKNSSDTEIDQEVNKTVVRANSNNNIFSVTNLFPRIVFKNSSGTSQSDTELMENNIYNEVARAEGIWVIAVKDKTSSSPQFYDFHIYTCWNAPGKEIPSTIGTIIRLYNPRASL